MSEAQPLAVAVTPSSWELPTSMITDPATFRAAFPEFTDATIYPDQQVQTYLDIGTALAGPRWGSLRQTGAHLVSAHMLALSRHAALRAGASGGAAPGINTGLLTSKSVSKVSVGYDTSGTGIDGGGPWNYTSYGTQYLWLMKLLGTGGYETLALGNPGMAGTVNTWARGVQSGWVG
jgi:hypothetical protein